MLGQERVETRDEVVMGCEGRETAMSFGGRTSGTETLTALLTIEIPRSQHPTLLQQIHLLQTLQDLRYVSLSFQHQRQLGFQRDEIRLFFRREPKVREGEFGCEEGEVGRI